MPIDRQRQRTWRRINDDEGTFEHTEVITDLLETATLQGLRAERRLLREERDAIIPVEYPDGANDQQRQAIDEHNERLDWEKEQLQNAIIVLRDKINLLQELKE
jgi:hypothetical protein